MNIAYISNDIDKTKEELLEKYNNIYVFEDIDLKLNLVKEIKEEAYLTTDIEKYILIKAVNFRIESQNALLKLLEESPDKVTFLLLTTSKYSLLETIRSRVEIKTIHYQEAEIKIDFLPERITTKNIYELLKKEWSKVELKQFIMELFKRIKNPNQRVLDNFELAIKLVDLNGDKQAILSLITLAIRDNNGNI